MNWLKQNAARGESLSTVGSQMTEKKVVPEIKNNEVKLFQEKNAFAPASTSASFATSWSSSTVSSSHAPALFGRLCFLFLGIFSMFPNWFLMFSLQHQNVPLRTWLETIGNDSKMCNLTNKMS